MTIDAGMPVFANLPDTSRPGVMIVALIGSRMLKPGREIAEAMPLLVRAQDPVVALDALRRQALRAPDLEPPVLAPFVVDLAHRAAEVERLGDRLLHQRGDRPAAPSSRPTTSHDAMIAYCGDVDVCIRYASLKIGRSSFRVSRVLHDDLRRLRDAGEQLVRRMRGEDQRVLAARPVAGRSHACRDRTRGTRRAAATPRRSAASRCCCRAWPSASRRCTRCRRTCSA